MRSGDADNSLASRQQSLRLWSRGCSPPSHCAAASLRQPVSNDDHRSTAATSKLPRCSRMTGHVRVSMLLPGTSRFGQGGLQQQPEPTVNHHAHMMPRHLFHGTRPETCLSNRLSVTSNGYHSNGWSPNRVVRTGNTLDHQRTELGSSENDLATDTVVPS